MSALDGEPAPDMGGDPPAEFEVFASSAGNFSTSFGPAASTLASTATAVDSLMGSTAVDLHGTTAVAHIDSAA